MATNCRFVKCGQDEKGRNTPAWAGAVMVSVVVAGVVPGVTDEWLKLAVAPEGKPETVSTTGLAKPFALVGVTVTVTAAELPALTEALGGALSAKSSIAKFTGDDGPVVGAGLVTVTAGVPPAARSLARTFAVNCVELTNVVGSDLPPKFTTEPARKFAPFTVNVKFAPAALFVGEMDEIEGTGLSMVADASVELAPSPATLIAETT